jgi:hypothetical protein
VKVLIFVGQAVRLFFTEAPIRSWEDAKANASSKMGSPIIGYGSITAVR